VISLKNSNPVEMSGRDQSKYSVKLIQFKNKFSKRAGKREGTERNMKLN
jgi:hypothetical protein